MRAPIDILVELLDQRGVRVEVEEYLRLHAALQRGEDWSAQRLQNVIVGILATSPAMARTIREAVGAALRELETQTETGVSSGGERARTKKPRGGALRLVIAVGVVVVLAVAAVIVIPLLRSSGGEEDGTSDANTTGEPGEEADDDADDAPYEDPYGHIDGDPVVEPNLETTGEADDQECDGAEQLERELMAQLAFEAEYDARREAAEAEAAAAEPEGPRARSVSVPQYVFVTPAGLRLPLLLGLGALGLGALGLLVFFVARARSRSEPPDLEAAALGPTQPVASGPSLFWLQPSEPPRSRALLLAHAERDAITWGLGHFSSGAARSRVLDADATVRASIDNGGLPSLRYAARRSLRRVWVWHDATVEGQVIRRLIDELEGLAHSHGLELELAHFWGTPDQLEDRHGQSLRLDELEEERDESIVCVLTDGRALLERWEWRAADGRDRRPELRALLRRMASWHRLAFFHHGAARQRRALDELLSNHGLRCFALGELPRFVEREGERRDNMAEGADHPGPIWRWAACCALYPLPVSELDALALRAALELPVSAYGVTSLRARSITTAGIQFAPEERARLITRLTGSDASTVPSDTPPALLQEALAFWRARTIAGAPDWATDATGRGIHRRLVVAQLDLWTNPERALQEFARLRASPHFDAIRDELARVRPRAEGDAPPATGPMIELPFSAARLQPGDRARLHALGMRALPAGDLVKTTGARVRPPALARPWLAVSSIFSLALGAAVLLSPPATRQVDDIAFPERSAFRVHEGRLELLAGGEWSALTYDDASALGEELVALERDGSRTRSLECVVELGELAELRRCGTTPRELEEFGRSRSVAVLDASREDRAARQFADRLLDDEVVDAVWIGAWPAWLREPDESALTESEIESESEALGATSPSAPLAEYFQNKGLSRARLWVFSDDPEFLLAAARRAQTEDLLDTPTALSALEDATGTRPAGPGVTSMSTLLSDCAPFDVWVERDGAALVLHGQTRSQRHGLAWDPGGRLLALTGYADGAARLIDASTGEVQRVLEGEAIREIVYTPDGSRVITADGSVARVWDAITGETVGNAARHDDTVSTLAVSPDGSHFVTGTSPDLRALMWNTNSGEQLFTIETTGADGLEFSPDGQRLAIRNQLGVQLVDTSTGDVLYSIDGFGDLNSATFSPDGRRLATANEDHTARLWDAFSGRASGDALRHADEVRTVRFSPDGRRLATASEDGSAALWDADTGERLHLLEGHDERILAVDFSPDGRRLATASSDDTARTWDTETGELQYALHGHDDVVLNVAFSPDGRRLATSSWGGTTRVWTLEGERDAAETSGEATKPLDDAAQQPLSRLYSAFGDAVETIEWVPSTRWGALAARVEPGVTTRSLDARAVSGRDVALEPVAKTSGAPQDFIHGLTPPVHARFLPLYSKEDGKAWRLLTVDAGGRVDLWHPSQAPPVELARSDEPITELALASGGDMIARTGYDGVVALHSLTSNAEVTTIETDKLVQDVAFMSDELLLRYTDRTASRQRVSDVRETIEDVLTIDPRAVLSHSQVVDGLVWSSPNAKTTLFGPEGTMDPDRAWVIDANRRVLISQRSIIGAMTTVALHSDNQSEIGTYSPHAGDVTATAFAPTRDLFVTGSRDRTARVRSISNTVCSPVILRHRAAVTDVAITSDGAIIAVTSEDGLVTTWSPGEEATRQALHSAAARTVAFDATDGYLVSTGDDGSVVVQELARDGAAPASPETWGLDCSDDWDGDGVLNEDDDCPEAPGEYEGCPTTCITVDARRGWQYIEPEAPTQRVASVVGTWRISIEDPRVGPSGYGSSALNEDERSSKLQAELPIGALLLRIEGADETVYWIKRGDAALPDPADASEPRRLGLRINDRFKHDNSGSLTVCFDNAPGYLDGIDAKQPATPDCATDPRDQVDATAVKDSASAMKICPVVCEEVGLIWNKRWRKTGSAAVCECETYCERAVPLSFAPYEERNESAPDEPESSAAAVDNETLARPTTDEKPP